jgi:hypothetical protein
MVNLEKPPRQTFTTVREALEAADAEFVARTADVPVLLGRDGRPHDTARAKLKLKVYDLIMDAAAPFGAAKARVWCDCPIMLGGDPMTIEYQVTVDGFVVREQKLRLRI